MAITSAYIEDAKINGWKTLFDSSGDNTAQALKTTPGILGGVNVYNPSNAVAYIQFFDLATGSVTVGTTTPKFVVALATLTSQEFDFNEGLGFETAMTYACTTTATGSGAPSSSLVLSFRYS